ncbi:MAG: isopentenyl-diphosphate delta-isomerase [Roseitalea sp.]|jgi:isopentenyl-diphosphate delta-isomerase|uniref:Isopentenyl-diphosphate delta-isomerase n=1 Tax=Oceaniradius stylonematis TaxID=2184161 RepID=A0A3A8A680_9HYPH|nr:isopentenyl-diphosphate delta-isomerase [Oceaniradius stylonematis]MBO6552840.1 isopentenyl-diphosphate delta-isomerase [Roseitalea sp.]MBO6950239.1 isopentenyl-diphosphate delta-isomerase [Rhizobiaceae bacterium]RNC94692.1 MAG: isopentenyl-diphosphate delta-isomerase [Oricola sp.]MBO6591772.1 isopentenyl-diphosphate delta-isomerase [Roseitalea sp.]MBO6599627.1 isopentenyl-diphosphate delta-isomerase [Roseitalea sp.]
MDTIRDTDPIIPAIAEDGSFYPIGKMQAHREAVFHLAVSVFVFSGEHLLIQQRAKHKYHCGGQWANTCCTHPHWDEPVATSAARRLREELGFGVPLTERHEVEYSADVSNGLHEHERVTMFIGHADRDTLVIRPNPDEVAAVRWVTADELRADMARDPEAYTPWFRIYCDRFPDLKI